MMAERAFRGIPNEGAQGILGGGLPLGALGGRAEIFEHLAPLGPVYQAGTLSGNPLATAAGDATLAVLSRGGSDFYATLDSKGARLEKGFREALGGAGVPFSINRVGSMMTVFFNSSPVENLESLENVDTERYGRFFHAMLEAGVAMPPSQYEAFFVSAAHSDADIDHVIEAARRAVDVLAKAPR